ncbi:DUF4261 domain-containing protein [Burkholderia sp. GS2Y]|uniref:DUF4261 domain-containing protein n=1 Tax=Burkholderia theae TaxID=3143496 RepID=A0ABU9WDL7_9BURK
MSSPVAAILSSQSVSIESKCVIEALQSTFPNLSIGRDGSNLQADLSSAIISVDGVMVALLSLPARLPDGWQVAARRAEGHWPQASKVCEQHQAHVLVSLMDSSVDRLRAAQIVTAVATAFITSHSTCSAVVWDSVVVSSSEKFAEYGRSAFADYPNFPISLWVSFHPFQEVDIVGLVTMGLANFAGREIELDGPRTQLRIILDRAKGLVVYLMKLGVAIHDGDTIGVSEGERITIRHTQSERFRGLLVFAGTLIFT